MARTQYVLFPIAVDESLANLINQNDNNKERAMYFSCESKLTSFDTLSCQDCIVFKINANLIIKHGNNV